MDDLLEAEKEQLKDLFPAFRDDTILRILRNIPVDAPNRLERAVEVLLTTTAEEEDRPITTTASRRITDQPPNNTADGNNERTNEAAASSSNINHDNINGAAATGYHQTENDLGGGKSMESFYDSTSSNSRSSLTAAAKYASSTENEGSDGLISTTNRYRSNNNASMSSTNHDGSSVKIALTNSVEKNSRMNRCLSQLRANFPQMNETAVRLRLSEAPDMDEAVRKLKEEFGSGSSSTGASGSLSAQNGDGNNNTMKTAAGLKRNLSSSSYPSTSAASSHSHHQPNGSDNYGKHVEINEQGPTSSKTMKAESAAAAPPAGLTKMNIIGQLPEALVIRLSNDTDLLNEIVQRIQTFSAEDQDNFLTVMSMFPDCDPSFINRKMAFEKFSKEALVDFIMNNDYPRVANWLEDERRKRRRQLLMNPINFDPKEYLFVYENPDEHFMNSKARVSDAYLAHQSVALSFHYPQLKKPFMSSIAGRCGFHFYQTTRLLDELIEKTTTHEEKKKMFVTEQTRKLRRRQNPEIVWPAVIDDQFFKEYQYFLFKYKLEEYKAELAAKKSLELTEARAAGLLGECQCCFDDEVIPSQLICCSKTSGSDEKHGFCSQCVKQHAETRIGDGGSSHVSCMEGGCDSEYPIAVLQDMIKPKLLNLLLKRIQQDAIREANVDNLEACPFCDFAAIIESSDVRVFRCRNPECLKESCRECKEDSHIPFKCNEVEQRIEVKMRTYVEEKMAEALIRKCPSCQKRMIKSDGCNKMTCPCGAYMCYVCGQELQHANPYDHFQQNKKCAMNTSIADVNNRVAEEAGREARVKFLKEHPEANALRDVNVKDLIDSANRGNPGGGLFLDDEAYEDDEDVGEGEGLDNEDYEEHELNEYDLDDPFLDLRDEADITVHHLEADHSWEQWPEEELMEVDGQMHGQQDDTADQSLWEEYNPADFE